MAYTATLRLPHLPSTFVVHLALFRDLENASFLRQQLLAGNAEYDYALIDASVVCTGEARAAERSNPPRLSRPLMLWQPFLELRMT